MSDDLDKKVHETDVDGSHVTVVRHGEDDFESHVSYKSYNKNGVHVASPTWSNRGDKEDTKNFIQREVNRASDHNKPKP